MVLCYGYVLEKFLPIWIGQGIDSFWTKGPSVHFLIWPFCVESLFPSLCWESGFSSLKISKCTLWVFFILSFVENNWAIILFIFAFKEKSGLGSLCYGILIICTCQHYKIERTDLGSNIFKDRGPWLLDWPGLGACTQQEELIISCQLCCCGASLTGFFIWLTKDLTKALIWTTCYRNSWDCLCSVERKNFQAEISFVKMCCFKRSLITRMEIRGRPYGICNPWLYSSGVGEGREARNFTHLQVCALQLYREKF